MNIQDRIVKIIALIQDGGQGFTREQLQRMLSTSDSTAVDWNAIFDKAIESGLLKIKNKRANTLTYTLEGKKYRKSPFPIHIGSVPSAAQSAPQSAAPSQSSAISDSMDDELLVVMRGASPQTDATGRATSARTKLQMKLIRAIDRKIALDDFAQSENIDLDELLDNLEDMRRHGKHMDISYFVNEVIGRDNIDEVRDSLDDEACDMKFLRSEWGDVYNEEELRLLCYVLS